MTESFTEIKESYRAPKTLVVKLNDPVAKKHTSLSFDGANKKLQHEIDCYALSEAISMIIRDYKKQGGADYHLLKLVVRNLENNFIEVKDTVVRGKNA